LITLNFNKMIYPQYTFDEDTNYDTVLVTVNQMYSDTLTPEGCCCSSGDERVLDSVVPILFAVSIDEAVEERYKSDIKSAYLILNNYLS
jgi:hypothetical protein